MCKTRFGSQGVILDGLKKNLHGTQDPPPIANAIKDSFFNPSLSWTQHLAKAALDTDLRVVPLT